MDLTRPTVAFTLSLSNTADGPHHSVYTQAYGLEMSMPDNWPVNTLIMAPPHLIPSITESTGVTTSGVVAGASHTPGNNDYDQIRDFGGCWVLARISDDMSKILDAGLGALLLIDDLPELDSALRSNSLTNHNLMVAFQINSITKLNTVAENAKQLKSKLTKAGLADAQILVSCSFEHNEIRRYLSLPDVSGLLLLDAYFGDIVDLVTGSAG
jgi:hypothetical protein